ncbi:MAG: arsenate reductase ArsC [Chlorobiaceae bacterium]
MHKKKNVLFLCTGNSCRSQMAEGLLRHLAGDRFEPMSAGLEPAHALHPLAVRVMAGIGIDISNQRPKGVEHYLGKTMIHYLIIVCDKAQKSCPRVWPGLADEKRYFWPLKDPSVVSGTIEEKVAAFRTVREELRETLISWVQEVEAPTLLY